MTFIVPVFHANGDALTSTDSSVLAGNVEALYELPYIKAYNTVSTGVPTATVTRVPLGATANEAYGFALTSGSVVVPEVGLYSAFFSVQMVAAGGSGADNIQARLLQNGTLIAIGDTNASEISFPQWVGACLMSWRTLGGMS